jgi:hypothetical protein
MEAHLFEPGCQRPLGRRVAQQEPPLLRLVGAPGRAARGQDVAVIFEGELADEPALIAAGRPAPVIAALDFQEGLRRHRDLLVPQILRQVEPG